MNIVKELLKLQLTDPTWINKYRKFIKDKSKKAVLIGSPAHGNLGDHAIAEEEKTFLKEYFNEYTIYDVQMPLYNTLGNRLRKNINHKDIIFISGGGWMGNLWLHNEKTIRDIIKLFPNNLIVIFPQTIYYTADDSGRTECLITNSVIEKHKNLILFTREEKSYKFAKENYSFSGASGVYLAPDMVLYGSGVAKLHKMNKIDKIENLINVCLRNDCEKANEVDLKKLIESMDKYEFRKIDTVLPYRVKLCNRNRELQRIWENFSQASLTITDRLHAMLFSVLNNTPCIAFDNKTNKVFGVASWLRELNLIYLVEDKSKLTDIIEKIMTSENELKYNGKFLKNQFDNMSRVIRERIILDEN